MANTIELAQACLSLIFSFNAHLRTDRKTRLPDLLGKEIPGSMAGEPFLRGFRSITGPTPWSLRRTDQREIPKVVWKFSLPLHEWIFASWACIHHIKGRVCCRVPTHARKARLVPSWSTCNRDANQGVSTSQLPPSDHLLSSYFLQAASDKIIREMELFGENFERYDPDVEDETPKSTANGPIPPTAQVGKATKGKLAAKSTGLTYQFQIMTSIGVPREEVKKFADPYYWLSYFPPICKVCRTSHIISYLTPYLTLE